MLTRSTLILFILLLFKLVLIGPMLIYLF